jgi:superfamily I DNA and/or RNA helicase
VNAAPWSFSRIKAFQQCPKQFYHEKVTKQYPFKQTAATIYGNQFHRAAEKYIRDGEELDPRFEYARGALDALNAKEGEKLCEIRMGLTKDLEPCRFGANDVWFRGIADLLILNRDKKLAWVVDYKTGKNAKYADKGQLELMALATFKHYPEVETIRAGLLFVVSNDLIKDRYTTEEEEKLWTKWFGEYSHMETAFENDTWNPNPSGLCKAWCPVLECPHNGKN